MHNIYGHIFPTPTLLTVNDCVEGEPIERRVERIMAQGEPIADGAPIIYTKRSDGVVPEYNVRTDRFDMALEMTDEITRQGYAKREEFHKSMEPKNGPESGQTPDGGTPTGTPTAS